MNWIELSRVKHDWMQKKDPAEAGAFRAGVSLIPKIGPMPRTFSLGAVFMQYSVRFYATFLGLAG
jgi:hypothetical protein